MQVGETCSDMQWLPILEEEECKTGIQEFGGTYSGGSDNINYPRGCYVFGDASVKGHFNRHESGSINKNTKSLCKGG